MRETEDLVEEFIRPHLDDISDAPEISALFNCTDSTTGFIDGAALRNSELNDFIQGRLFGALSKHEAKILSDFDTVTLSLPCLPRTPIDLVPIYSEVRRVKDKVPPIPPAAETFDTSIPDFGRRVTFKKERVTLSWEDYCGTSEIKPSRFLSGSDPETFDSTYIRYIMNKSRFQNVFTILPNHRLKNDILLLLNGVPSDTFELCTSSAEFSIRRIYDSFLSFRHVPFTSIASFNHALTGLLKQGSLFYQLEQLVASLRLGAYGETATAYGSALGSFMNYVKAYTVKLGETVWILENRSSVFNIIELYHTTEDLHYILETLSAILTYKEISQQVHGGQLLSKLFDRMMSLDLLSTVETESSKSKHKYLVSRAILVSLLQYSSVPFLQWLQQWICIESPTELNIAATLVNQEYIILQNFSVAEKFHFDFESIKLHSSLSFIPQELLTSLISSGLTLRLLCQQDSESSLSKTILLKQRSTIHWAFDEQEFASVEQKLNFYINDVITLFSEFNNQQVKEITQLSEAATMQRIGILRKLESQDNSNKQHAEQNIEQLKQRKMQLLNEYKEFLAQQEKISKQDNLASAALASMLSSQNEIESNLIETEKQRIVSSYRARMELLNKEETRLLWRQKRMSLSEKRNRLESEVFDKDKLQLADNDQRDFEESAIQSFKLGAEESAIQSFNLEPLIDNTELSPSSIIGDMPVENVQHGNGVNSLLGEYIDPKFTGNSAKNVINSQALSDDTPSDSQTTSGQKHNMESQDFLSSNMIASGDSVLVNSEKLDLIRLNTEYRSGGDTTETIGADEMSRNKDVPTSSNEESGFTFALPSTIDFELHSGNDSLLLNVQSLMSNLHKHAESNILNHSNTSVNSFEKTITHYTAEGLLRSIELHITLSNHISLQTYLGLESYAKLESKQLSIKSNCHTLFNHLSVFGSFFLLRDSFFSLDIQQAVETVSRSTFTTSYFEHNSGDSLWPPPEHKIHTIFNTIFEKKITAGDEIQPRRILYFEGNNENCKASSPFDIRAFDYLKLQYEPSQPSLLPSNILTKYQEISSWLLKLMRVDNAINFVSSSLMYQSRFDISSSRLVKMFLRDAKIFMSAVLFYTFEVAVGLRWKSLLRVLDKVRRREEELSSTWPLRGKDACSALLEYQSRSDASVNESAESDLGEEMMRWEEELARQIVDIPTLNGLHYSKISQMHMALLLDSHQLYSIFEGIMQICLNCSRYVLLNVEGRPDDDEGGIMWGSVLEGTVANWHKEFRVLVSSLCSGLDQEISESARAETRTRRGPADDHYLALTILYESLIDV
ncbi:hypothetical protein BJ742DRAFT_823163 [Cladochytrium replicatum]|nr:hypothetical protein BJ742DRAFT_823163 [Cladochytrium replicatum]